MFGATDLDLFQDQMFETFLFLQMGLTRVFSFVGMRDWGSICAQNVVSGPIELNCYSRVHVFKFLHAMLDFACKRESMRNICFLIPVHFLLLL